MIKYNLTQLHTMLSVFKIKNIQTKIAIVNFISSLTFDGNSKSIAVSLLLQTIMQCKFTSQNSNNNYLTAEKIA